MNEELYFANSGDEQLIAGERLWNDFWNGLDDYQRKGVRRFLDNFAELAASLYGRTLKSGTMSWAFVQSWNW